MFRSATVLFLLSIATQGLGLAMQLALALLFGVGHEVDAYVAAAALPSLAEAVLLAPTAQLLVPPLVRYVEVGDRASAWRLLWACTLSVLVVGSLFTLATLAVGRIFIRVSTPGLDPVTAELAIAYLPWLSLATLAGAATVILTQQFHAEKRLALPAVLGVLAQIITVGFVLALSHTIQLWSLIAGALLGRLVAVGVLAADLVSRGFRPTRIRDLGGGLVSTIPLALPAVVTLASTRVNAVTDRFFASFLGTGALAALGYGDRAVAIVLAVLIAPVVTVMYPQFATHEARGDRKGLLETLDRGIEAIVFGTVPLALATILLSKSCLHLLLEGGSLSSGDIDRIAVALSGYSGLLVVGGVGSLVVRSFYSVGDTVSPMIWGGFIPVGLNLLFDFIVYQRLGLLGIALVSSVTPGIVVPVMYMRLRGRLGVESSSRWARFLTRVCICGAAFFLSSRMITALELSPRAEIFGITTIASAAYLLCGIALRLQPATFFCEKAVATARRLNAEYFRS